jgi:hypothetical protein
MFPNYRYFREAGGYDLVAQLCGMWASASPAAVGIALGVSPKPGHDFAMIGNDWQ